MIAHGVPAILTQCFCSEVKVKSCSDDKFLSLQYYFYRFFNLLRSQPRSRSSHYCFNQWQRHKRILGLSWLHIFAINLQGQHLKVPRWKPWNCRDTVLLWPLLPRRPREALGTWGTLHHCRVVSGWIGRWPRHLPKTDDNSFQTISNGVNRIQQGLV